MVINKKVFKRHIFIVFDMLICLICALFVSIFFYKIGLISFVPYKIMFVSIILLPSTMAMSLTLCRCYKEISNTSIKQLNKHIIAIFLCIGMYIILDVIFGYYSVIIVKIISALLAALIIIQSRIIYMFRNIRYGVEKTSVDREKEAQAIDEYMNTMWGDYMTIESIKVVQTKDELTVNTEEFYDEIY